MVNVGGVNVINEIVYLEYQLIRTQKILDKVINDNIKAGKLSKLNQDDIKKIDEDAFVEMKNKFPQLGLTRNN